MPRWLGGIFLGAAVGGALYAAGLGGPVVYVLRGIALHFFYRHGGR
jgi:hypothetical protein